MIKSNWSIHIATGAALFVGIAVLSGCGPAPYSHTTTSEQTTTTTPSPVVSTETITTEQNSQRR
jgi:hypothetical protein